MSSLCTTSTINFPTQIYGLIPFYLTWDLDGIFQTKVSTDRNEDDRHSKLMVGSNKTVGFVYRFSQPMRHYVESATILKDLWDTDNMKDCLKKIWGDKAPYRVPG